MSEIKLAITGMTCGHCVRATTRALEAVPGVETVEVTLTPGAALIHGDAEPAALIAAVNEEGYQAALQD